MEKITAISKPSPQTFSSTMGCRTYNGLDVNFEDGFRELVKNIVSGKEPNAPLQVSANQKDGRGNICPVTIILPTLAMEAKEAFTNECDDTIVDVFIDILSAAINDAKDTLIERFDWICSQSAASAKFMYDNNLMLGYKPEEGIKSAMKHGTLAVGQLGLAECLQILIGKDHTTSEGMQVAKRIEQLFKDKCSEFKQRYKLNFGVYYTPAENLSYTAMTAFKNKYGVIKNVSDRDYFTNSMHVPVWYNMDPLKKMNIEAQLTGYSNAGCITYVELDASCKHNTRALEKIVNYAMSKDIPYFAINVPNDQCCDCGYTGSIDNNCPECGSNNITRLRRVTGYLSQDYRLFNFGKQKEVEQREKHNNKIDF